MTFTESIKSCFSNAFNFSGRAPRAEFWFFALFMFLTYFTVNILFLIVCIVLVDTVNPLSVYTGVVAVYSLIGLIMFLPSLSVAIRRLHDSGHSGWWIFISWVPPVGFIWYFILMCKESDEENDYGLPVY